jgi:ubiquinone/menaquinone biosynthesis C-methylase UbiE
MNKTIDVGSGNHPMGDINLDINPKCKCKNFIHGDAHYLPFREDVFDLAIANHLIEHTINPVQIIKELCRVSRDQIQITAPHRYSKVSRCSDHKYSFNTIWFENVFRMLRIGSYQIRLSVSLFSRPCEIKINIKK